MWCSGGVSRLWLRFLGAIPPFERCCQEHDLFYEQGGGWRNKWFADRLLRECMQRSGHPALAWIFWLAVSTAGWLWWLRERL